MMNVMHRSISTDPMTYYRSNQQLNILSTHALLSPSHQHCSIIIILPSRAAEHAMGLAVKLWPCSSAWEVSLPSSRACSDTMMIVKKCLGIINHNRVKGIISHYGDAPSSIQLSISSHQPISHRSNITTTDIMHTHFHLEMKRRSHW